MMVHVDRAPPGVSVFPGRGLWATLHAMDDDDLGAAALADCQAVGRRDGHAHHRRSPRSAVEAVVRGRQGDHERGRRPRRAGAHHARRDRHRRRASGTRQQVLVSMAAIRDGWGDPAAWLRESEAFFAAGGYERAARRCRTLIGEAGAPVPRRRSDATVVPPSLRALGVTSRELDVLAARRRGLHHPGDRRSARTSRPRRSSATWRTCSTAPACGTAATSPRSAASTASRSG